MRISSYFVPLCTLALSACFTPYQTSFDCPVQNGVPCTSMTKINKMIDKGLLGKPEEDHSKEHCGCEADSYEGDSEQKRIYITHFKPKMEANIIPAVAVENISSHLESQQPIESSTTLNNTTMEDQQAHPSPLANPPASLEAAPTTAEELSNDIEPETIDVNQPDTSNLSLDPEDLEMPKNCRACTVTDEEINV